MQKQYRKGINRVIGVFCALVLLFSALCIPLVVGAAAPVNSVDIKDGEAFLFDIENVVSDAMLWQLWKRCVWNGHIFICAIAELWMWQFRC